MVEGLSPNDTQPNLPKMVTDAIKVVETDWHEPPAEEMQRAQDYFAQRILDTQILNSDWAFNEPTEKEFYEFVDALRHKVWDDLDLNAEIDKIMQLKDSFGSKIVSLQNSEVLKPHLK